MLESLMVFDGSDLYNSLSGSFLLVGGEGSGTDSALPTLLRLERPSGATLGNGLTSSQRLDARIFTLRRSRSQFRKWLSKLKAYSNLLLPTPMAKPFQVQYAPGAP
jgi:hypothetical protein